VKANHKCSICGGPFTEREKKYWLGGGHNAQPINDGRCCGTCNDEVVVPERWRRIQERWASEATN
jgi:hypothetical protein